MSTRRPPESPDWHTIPMPLDLPTTGRTTTRKRTPRVVATETCPGCGNATNLRRIGGHATWKDHDRTVIGDTRIPCPNSGKPACGDGIEEHCRHLPAALTAAHINPSAP